MPVNSYIILHATNNKKKNDAVEQEILFKTTKLVCKMAKCVIFQIIIIYGDYIKAKDVFNLFKRDFFWNSVFVFANEYNG